jgi:hypothetical protein
MSTKLNPTIVTESTVGDAAFDGVRRRPVVAINEEGKLVVCCLRTAAKHGWKVEGTLHQRTRTDKKEGTPKSKKAPAAKDRRATDSTMTMVPKAALKTIRAARTVLDDSVDSILGK